MSLKNFLCVSLAVVGLLCSCDNTKNNGKGDNPNYEGENKIYLETKKDPMLFIGDEGAIDVKLTSTLPATNDTEFTFAIKALDAAGNTSWVKIKENQIILKKGTRELTFHIVANSDIQPNAKLSSYELEIVKCTDEKMVFDNKSFRFSLFNFVMPPLTDEQKKMISEYKSKGLNILPFLGKVDVKTTVNIPADGVINGLNKPETKVYEGFSIITLSEKSTIDKPVLKMIYNPMGLNEFFYAGLRYNTIENDEFWFAEGAGELYKEICDLIHWNRNSVETFSATLDNISINDYKSGNGNPIKFVGTSFDAQGDSIVAVPFEFQYSAWDRQKKLIDDGNQKAIECHEAGASACPDRYLNTTDITNDAFESEGQKFDPDFNKGFFISDEKKMKFVFYTSVENAGWYITVTTEYTAN